MKRSMFLLAISVLSVALAQTAPDGEDPDEVDTTGILSYIEDLPDPANEEDPFRKVPFVEVIEETRLGKCQEVGFDSDECETFEWSAPFVPETLATDAEKVIVDAWFRYESRAVMRTNLEIGAAHPLLACTIGGLDLYWLIKEGSIFIPPEEFCDGKGPAVFNACFWACDFNIFQSECPDAKPGCGDCINEGLERAQEHYPKYAKDYFETVITDVYGTLSAAGGLNWRESMVPGSGALTVPVMTLNPVTGYETVADFTTRILPEAIQEDPRAVDYYSQAGALNDPCATAMPGLQVGLPGLPGAFDPTAPGLAGLEMFKRELADREDAGDTWKRTVSLLFNWDEEALYPQYTKADGILGNMFGGEEAKGGLLTPLQYACLGAATFFQVSEKFEPAPLVHRPVIRVTTCWIPGTIFPGLTVAPNTPHIVTLTGPRFHTEWATVPEGYAIPNVKGTLQLNPGEMLSNMGDF